MALSFSYGGHAYQIVTVAKTWAAANAYATSVGGHLATISSLAEQSTIIDNYYLSLSVGTPASDGGNAFYLWLGGTDSAAEGTWRWVDGSIIAAPAFTNWGSGALGSEPDNGKGLIEQDALAMSLTVWPYPNGGIGVEGKWNDLSAADLLFSVIEWDSDSQPVAPKLITTNSFKYSVNPQVTMQTTLGTVVIELDPAKAPITVANLLAYAGESFYDGTLFHRVIPNFVAQGGGLELGLNNKLPIYDPIVSEANNGLSNVRGTIAMALAGASDTATSGFYINVVNNASLNYGNSSGVNYTVFGHVISGMAVVDSIVQVPTATVGIYANVPQANIFIDSLHPSTAGSAITNGSFDIGALEAGASWAYSLNGGVSWIAGSGTSLLIPDGSYAADAIQVRQTGTTGLTSATTGKYGSALLVDHTVPTVTNFSPADGLTGVAIGSDIVLSFSESVFRGTGIIFLKNAANAVVESFVVASSDRLSFNGTTLTINPTADLLYGNGYKVELAAGTVQDIAANGYVGTTTYHFTTEVLGTSLDLLAYSWKAHTLLTGVSYDDGARLGTTNTSGVLNFAAVPGSSLTVAAQRAIPSNETSDTDAAVNLNDAIAILKMIVGLDVNGAAKPLSPYQAIAADFDGNGAVNLNDAIGVLKHVVGLTAPQPAWLFFNEADTTMAARATLNPGTVAANFSAAIGGTNTHIGIVGVLRGDVDGSFAGAGTLHLDTTQPTYFVDLALHSGINQAQFGIYT